MSPGEELREAARLMRERAQAATPGPWENPLHNEVTHGYAFEWPSRHIATWIATCDSGDEDVSEEQEVANAQHIAGMHPLVAAPFADLLEAAAFCGCMEGDDHWELRSAAIRAARAYLGTDDSPPAVRVSGAQQDAAKAITERDGAAGRRTRPSVRKIAATGGDQ